MGRTVLCAMLCATAVCAAAAAEPSPPSRSGQIDEVIRRGDELNRALDTMQAESGAAAGLAASADEDVTIGRYVVMFVTSIVGLAFLVYGKKQMKPAFLVCGALLTVYPYALSDVVSLVLVGGVLCAAPWFLKRVGVGC
jgi:hypothetical protein